MLTQLRASHIEPDRTIKPKWSCSICEKQCTRRRFVKGVLVVICANCEEAGRRTK